MAFDPKQHWEKVYQAKKPTEVSWRQDHPAVSLDLIALTDVDFSQKIIDVGGGASVLVDKLLGKGFKEVTVLDISSKAIQYAKERLGKLAGNIAWIEADITKFDPSQQYDLWHDRAVFHFLTAPEDRERYVEVMTKAVKVGGHVIIATFAMEGPPKCSGLDVKRYNPDKLKAELGSSFNLVKWVSEVHMTPWNSEQKFIYFYFKKDK